MQFKFGFSDNETEVGKRCEVKVRQWDKDKGFTSQTN